MKNPGFLFIRVLFMNLNTFLNTVDDIKSCITHNEEYTIIPIVYGHQGNAGFTLPTRVRVSESRSYVNAGAL